jgi:predicted TIM-barrel fold metal-dependent hydrolase
MVASNFPVDKASTGSLRTVYDGIAALLEAARPGGADGAGGLSDSDWRALFHDTAARAYGLPVEA